MELLDTARKLVATGPVCDPCLGRPFADRSFGLTNAERGKAVRVSIALEDDEPYESPDREDCWVCEGHTARFDTYAELIAEGLEGVSFETYQVGTRAPPLVEENEMLFREDAGMEPDAGELFKSEFNREVGKRVGQRTKTDVDFERPDVLAVIDLERAGEDPSTHAVDVQVNPAFVFGRYRKLERDIPQTEWPCRECGGTGVQLSREEGEEPCDYCGGSGYLYDDSVEGFVAPHVLDAMDGSEAIFHGAGREDVDALMLGTGRPFVVEVKDPKVRSPDAEALEAEINEAAAGSVEVDGLRLATHEMVERVKELDASKTYRAEVEFGDDVTEEALADAVAELTGTTVTQHTPQRVDHRRASLDRTRTVYDISADLEDDRHATVDIHGEGGLYIKELISGDDGRTEPSLAGLLGTEATVTALDVLAVEGEDEEFDDPDYLR
ncbi:tRNA pseudouridine(54/55) synthase Pus10 [Haloarchaeobius sp. DYHT-AS-18]|uniref:tRNA pseudouridine(54/55) synthase Pus10 n=1 Tax=Haloarchaeobius sp. DYHT-AS-18 TaxID=3446117 RepID=UPI003EB7BE87